MTTFYRGQVVDTPAAREFTERALERATQTELADVAELLGRKSHALTELLTPDTLADLDEEQARAVLRSVFSTRRHADIILGALGLDRFGALIEELLRGGGPAAERLASFHAVVGGIGRGVHPTTGYDLGSELLHFTDPDAHWLWTRWIWDPDTEAGALPLILTEDIDLLGAGVEETYGRVGVAIAFVNEVGEAAGFRPEGHGVFGTDVFLGCVYAVYLYTTLRMRMTQEFNQVVPDLGELLRRLLGVHRSPLLAGASA